MGDRSRFLSLATTTLLLSIAFSVVPISGNWKTAIVRAQTEDDREADADRLLELCQEQLQASQYEAAIDSCQQALDISQEIGDSNLESTALKYIGLAYENLENYSKATEFFQRTLAILLPENEEPSAGSLDEFNFEQLVSSIVDTREHLGNSYIRMGEYTKAIEHLERDLAWGRSDLVSVRQTLLGLGNIYMALGDYTQAIDYFEEGLAITLEIGDRTAELEVLSELGSVRVLLGDSTGLSELQQSLAIARKVGNPKNEVQILNNIGLAYKNLGEFHESIVFFQQALEFHLKLGDLISQDMGDLGGEAHALHNIGLAYNDERQYEKALNFYQKALDIWRNTGNLGGQATALNNIGLVHSELGQFESAFQSIEKAISILRSLTNRSKEGNVLDSLGTVYRQAKQYDRALAAYEEALAVLRSTGNRSTEQVTLSNIAQLFEEQGKSELAIVFYKQSVNIIEEIRQDLRTLPREQQQSYTETVADTYRNLADLLLKNDRILEAQRVLDLLKVQELDDYLHNVRGNENTTQGLPNLPAEQEAWESYQKILDEAVEIGKELSQLQQKENLTPEENQRLTELTDAQEALREAFNNFTGSPEVLALVSQRSPETLSQDLLLRMGEFNGLQDNLRNLEQNAVLLYPLILDDRLELILTTGNSPPIRRTVPVSKAELNAAIVAFRSALQTPGSDAKTPAQKLYNWLIQPLESDLKAANAETLIYAPDGQLRYIPLAALHDGENWLVQRYRINNITAASLTDLNTKPQPQLNVLAGAFANGYYSFTVGEQTYNFAGLPFAGVEVETLAQTVPATTPLLDTDFTPAVVPQFNRYNTVHLATHGAFVVGTPDDSFILFGNGERASLRDIATWGLTNVDLVVLSACETGLGGNLGNGEEILGLGYQIQEAGARAAIASLWIVDDGGTQVLMNAFYAGLQREMTKAEALRQAQIALITGDYTAVGGERGAIEIVPVLDRLPRQVASGLSHPYYWAPFILIGNGL